MPYKPQNQRIYDKDRDNNSSNHPRTVISPMKPEIAYQTDNKSNGQSSNKPSVQYPLHADNSTIGENYESTTSKQNPFLTDNIKCD
jgi:hypothetical protein